jgi:hypothetical protein
MNEVDRDMAEERERGVGLPFDFIVYPTQAILAHSVPTVR